LQAIERVLTTLFGIARHINLHRSDAFPRSSMKISIPRSAFSVNAAVVRCNKTRPGLRSAPDVCTAKLGFEGKIGHDAGVTPFPLMTQSGHGGDTTVPGV
jgi:hypothetical protein